VMSYALPVASYRLGVALLASSRGFPEAKPATREQPVIF
jgi:hypothetical protein